MSQKFVVAIDGSDEGWKALEVATGLAKSADAELIAVHVIAYEPMPDSVKEFARVEGMAVEEETARYRIGRLIGDNITGDAEARVRKAGLSRIKTQVVEGNPAHEIVAAAQSLGADMIFLGSRGLGAVTSLLMGSVSHKVMHLAPCTCVVVR